MMYNIQYKHSEGKHSIYLIVLSQKRVYGHKLYLQKEIEF